MRVAEIKPSRFSLGGELNDPSLREVSGKPRISVPVPVIKLTTRAVIVSWCDKVN